MSENTGKKFKVLIVDDSAIARGIFEKAFKGTDLFEVAGSVSNGRKAVDFCRATPVDLVVTDYDMPEMNGVEATSIIAKELGIPVCVYSEDNSAKADALGAGAMLYEIKPSFSSLRGKLDELLSFSNIQFSNVIESDNVEFIIDFVRKEKYIGYLPYEIIDKLEDKMSFEKIYFDDKKLTYDIPASKKFVEMLDEKESVN